MAESIIDSAISFYSPDDIRNQIVSFDFRNRSYEVQWNPTGVYYQSRYRDSLGMHHRHLKGGEYAETLNGNSVEVSKKDASAKSSSVNSVLYFGLLPYHLQDEAVISKYLGLEEIEGKPYHKVEVRFTEEGGGEDFEDVFLYWFDKATFSMDYLAYSYIEDEGGTRFRKAYHTRRINGIVFQDYENYKGPASPDSLSFISDLFKNGDLKLLSRIEMEQIRVRERE